MDIYTTITAYFKAAPAFASIPIHYGLVPQGAVTPCLRFTVISLSHVGISHDGSTGLVRARIQFDGVHKLISSADLVRRKVRTLIDNFTGQMGGGLNVQSCLPMGVGRDIYDTINSWWLASQDWQIEYEEENG